MRQWLPEQTVPKTANYTAFNTEGENLGCVYLKKDQKFPSDSGSYFVQQ